MVVAGSDDAFGALYRRYHQSIYRYCLSLLRQEADARDALQSAMLAALSSLRARPIEGAFKPWLFRIAHNHAISIIRGRAREAPTEAPSPVAVTDDPEAREQLRTLVDDLSALPDRQRGAIVMRELSGLSYMEIGAALGTSQAAGKQLVYEARSALQDLREGHEMSCELVRERISARDRRLLRGRKVRSHLRGCQPCQDFERAIGRRRSAFALLAPPLSPLVAGALLRDVFGGGATSGRTRAVRVARRAPPVWPRGASQWSPDRWRSRWRPRCCSPGPPGSVPMRRGRRSLLTVRLRCRRQPPPPGRQLITPAGPVATTPREPRPRATAPATLERARPTRTRARRPPAIPPRPMGAGARRATTRQRPGPTVRRPPPARVSRTPPARLGRTPLGRSPRTPLEQPPRVVVPAAAAPAVGIPATALPDRRHRHRRPHRLP